MIYLASPFTHPDPAIREARFQAACRQAAEMLRCGIPVFSPIAHSHGIAAQGLPMGWEFWEPIDRAFLAMCSDVWVLMLDGWQESLGVQAEIAIAREMGKPVVFVEPDCNMNDHTPAVVSRAGVVEAEVNDAPTP